MPVTNILLNTKQECTLCCSSILKVRSDVQIFFSMALDRNVFPEVQNVTQSGSNDGHIAFPQSGRLIGTVRVRVSASASSERRVCDW